MSDDSYHLDFSYISKSMLSLYMESPLEYYRAYVTREDVLGVPPSSIVGSICHKILLEGKSIEDVAVAYPSDCLKSNGAKNPKPAKEFENSIAPGKFAVKSDVFQQVDNIINAAQNDMNLMSILNSSNSVKEEPIRVIDPVFKLKLKCKPDILDVLNVSEGNPYPQLSMRMFDLKITSTIKPAQYWRIADKFYYWLQSVFYLYVTFINHVKKEDLEEICAGKNVLRNEVLRHGEFIFIVIEDSPPFRIATYSYTTQSLEWAFKKMMMFLDKINYSYVNNVWDDQFTKIMNYLICDPSEIRNKMAKSGSESD